MNRLGLDIFPTLRMKRHVLLRVRAHLTYSHLVRSVTFVVLTADQLVGRNDGPPKQQKQDSHLRRRKRTFPLILKARILTTKRRKYKRIRIKNEILDI